MVTSKATKEELTPYLKSRLGKVNSVCKYANDGEKGQRLNFHRACVRLLSDECLAKRNEFAECLANTAETFSDKTKLEGDSNGEY